VEVAASYLLDILLMKGINHLGNEEIFVVAMTKLAKVAIAPRVNLCNTLRRRERETRSALPP
jgi:hypothetical protein